MKPHAALSWQAPTHRCGSRHWPRPTPSFVDHLSALLTVVPLERDGGRPVAVGMLLAGEAVTKNTRPTQADRSKAAPAPAEQPNFALPPGRGGEERHRSTARPRHSFGKALETNHSVLPGRDWKPSVPGIPVPCRVRRRHLDRSARPGRSRRGRLWSVRPTWQTQRWLGARPSPAVVRARVGRKFRHGGHAWIRSSRACRGWDRDRLSAHPPIPRTQVTIRTVAAVTPTKTRPANSPARARGYPESARPDIADAQNTSRRSRLHRRRTIRELPSTRRHGRRPGAEGHQPRGQRGSHHPGRRQGSSHNYGPASTTTRTRPPRLRQQSLHRQRQPSPTWPAKANKPPSLPSTRTGSLPASSTSPPMTPSEPSRRRQSRPGLPLPTTATCRSTSHAGLATKPTTPSQTPSARPSTKPWQRSTQESSG